MDKMIQVLPYEGALKKDWDTFISQSKNGTFLFCRDYMDYHADRFKDSSLVINGKDGVCALFPCNRDGDICNSHGGLTYGGLIYSVSMRMNLLLEIFSEINAFLRSSGVKKVLYKAVPYIYCKYPAQEDLYALYRLKASLVSRSFSSCIDMSAKIKFSELRKRGAQKAARAGIAVKESPDLGSFWNILSQNLHEKYGLVPTHQLKEIQLLRSRFPKNIRLFVAERDSVILAGCVVYETEKVVHIQYIAASELGKKDGALDLMFEYLINEYYKNKNYFDFGVSTEGKGDILNNELVFQKEGFGARGVVYDVYEYEPKAIV